MSNEINLKALLVSLCSLSKITCKQAPSTKSKQSTQYIYVSLSRDSPAWFPYPTSTYLSIRITRPDPLFSSSPPLFLEFRVRILCMMIPRIVSYLLAPEENGRFVAGTMEGWIWRHQVLDNSFFNLIEGSFCPSEQPLPPRSEF